MPAIVIPNTLLATVRGAYQGEEWNNVIGLTSSTTFLLDQTVVNEIADVIRTAYASAAAAFSTAWTLTDISIADLRTATSPAWDSDVVDLAGSAAGAGMSPNIAVCVSHQTGFRGRSYRGRTYLTGIPTSTMENDGTIASSRRALFIGIFANMRLNLPSVSVGDFTQAVVSRKLLEATPVTSSTVDLELDHQDRRKRS